MELTQLTTASLAKLFDHTLLRADATREEFEALCRDSMRYGFAMVAINSAPVALCKELLAGSPVHVGAAIGFPLGQTTVEAKVFETRLALQQGADEIDYVVNLGMVKDGNWPAVQEEMRRIVAVCREARACSKVIFENCYLTGAEMDRLCDIALRERPDFIKTSTGFGPGGARVEDVRRMAERAGQEIQVKAAGGIRSWESCRVMLEAGARRIGTSASIRILEEFQLWQAQRKG